MNASMGELKAALRARIRARAQQVSDAERAEDSAAIRDRLRQQPVWQRAAAVLFFAPLPGEPDVWPLLAEALSAAKETALLRHAAATDAYAAFRVADPRRDVQSGFLGIREPVPACPPADLNRLDLVLVPGVAFGLDGGRLGRGKGYYDRLLAGVQGWKCGIAFDWQLEPEIPMDARDVRLDSVVTPTCWHEVRPPPRSAA
jgi:5-formyltetrahydrofolate cyclo-ligase